MGSVWTVARQTIAEGIRMKIAVFFIILLGVLLFGLPFASKGDDSLSGAVRSFLSYSIGTVTFLLSCLTIFLSKSVSNDMVGKQILVLMSKPLARWQYITGKWLGIVLINFAIMVISGVAIYGMTLYVAGKATGLWVMSGIIVLLFVGFFIAVVKSLASVSGLASKTVRLVSATVSTVGLATFCLVGLFNHHRGIEPRDDWDRDILDNQILVARHSSPFKVPTDQFDTLVNNKYEQNVAEGRYANDKDHNPEIEKGRLRKEIEQRWRTVWPGGFRVFEFDDVRCPRTEGGVIHIKYEARLFNYPPDEVLRARWVFGNRAKGTDLAVVDRKDVRERIHTIAVPVSAVAKDNTLTATFYNQDPFLQPGEEMWPTSVMFEGGRGIEVLFPVSTFGSNLVRALSLVMCRLAFLAAVGVFCVSFLSFPVACLVSLSVYTLASLRGFLLDSIDFLEAEGVVGVFRAVFGHILQALFFVVPDFAKVNGLELLVDGRNVTLMWVLYLGIGKVVIIQTGILLLVACLAFQRREVSEISV